MPIEVQFNSTGDILTQIARVDLSNALRRVCLASVQAFEKEFKDIFHSRVSQLELSNDVKTRWGIAGISKSALIAKVFDAISIQEDEDGARFAIDLRELEREGISPALMNALLYGHPDGIPPLAPMRTASERIVLQKVKGLGRQFFDALH